MEIEDVKRVWDSQGDPVPGLDAAAVEERVRARVECQDRRTATSELGLTAITGFTGLFLAGTAALEGQPASAYASAVVLLGIAVYVQLGRWRRRHAARGFGDSLRGRLDRSIADLDATIARDRRFFAWFIVPMALATAVSVPLGSHRAIGVWAVQSAAWVLAWAVTRWEVRARAVPRRRSLAKLRDELTPQRC